MMCDNKRPPRLCPAPSPQEEKRVDMFSQAHIAHDSESHTSQSWRWFVGVSAPLCSSACFHRPLTMSWECWESQRNKEFLYPLGCGSVRRRGKRTHTHRHTHTHTQRRTLMPSVGGGEIKAASREFSNRQ